MIRKWQPNVMDKSDTLEYIRSTKCSIGRFGDGEVSLMAMIGIGFQRPSWKLRKELIEVARSNNPDFLVCIPYLIKDPSHLVASSQKWWKSNLRLMGGVWKHYFDRKNAVFGDTAITRPWLNIQDNELASKCFSLLTDEFKDKDIVLIEGEKSRVGVGNDFLAKARSVKRILCPVKNAYSKIDKIEAAALELATESNLFILALGPTATVLSYRLCKKGYRALDIGHMDIEYEWWKMKATKKTPVANKYVNEAGGYKTFKEMEIDANYNEEIAIVIE